MDGPGKRRWRWFARGGAAPPPPDARTWLHPSELPDFGQLPNHPAVPVGARGARLAGVVLVIGVAIAAAALATSTDSTPTPEPMTSNVTYSVTDLPADVQTAAARTVDLTITTPGHVATVAAMVLPHDLAVTPAAIPQMALLTGWVPGHPTFPVTWVGRDTAMGFTIVRLGRPVRALVLGALPANAAVVALSPMITGPTTRPRFTWSNTSLGDPTLRANGVISYLATASDQNLNGVPGAVAVDHVGHVVAVLATDDLWFSAQFVARVATIVATGHGCHASLNVAGRSAQGGGALITNVPLTSQSRSHLQRGDIVTVVNHHDIDSWSTLLTVLYLTPAGTNAHVTVLRGTRTYHEVVPLACAL